MANVKADKRVAARTASREFVTRRIAQETLVVPVAGGVGDLDAIYTLNEVAARIWSALETPTTVDDIVAAVCREFDVAADRAEGDVLDFLDKLESAGLVTRSTGSDGRS
jgi:hypothetical protein